MPVDGCQHVGNRPMFQPSCVEHDGKQRRRAFAPVRGLATIGARARGSDHGLGDENRSVPGSCKTER
jgi:hypothetical protein